MEQALAKINRAMRPYTVKIKRLEWFSQFSVKESVAEKFRVGERVFLAGDACHIHSVNGGQVEEFVMTDTGHSPFLEKPEEFVRAFCRFLAGKSPASA